MRGTVLLRDAEAPPPAAIIFMAKLWQGRSDGVTDSLADEFNSSVSFDKRMYRQDIEGSCAHAKMLAKCGIITEDEAAALVGGLEGILGDIESGKLKIDDGAEDIHMFVEAELTSRVGSVGKKLHTARSRNDQVALDMRLYLRGFADTLTDAAKDLVSALADRAEEHAETIMPGYTHLQRAQPITFGHQLTAYAMMLLRDIDRLSDCRRRTNVSPIGSCALAGTTFSTDRMYEAAELGFDGVCLNSIDGVSDRDFALELLGCLSIMMMHLSRLSEELILWSSWEFSFIELDDAFTTGSSIMPQKKNSDMAELIRGKTGRVYGDLVALLTVLKGLPLAYNKDMQEDKERVFDACDTALSSVRIMTPMIRTMSVKKENMRRAAGTGFINATDLADYLVGRGLPFREAYKISGRLVSRAMADEKTLETLPLEVYREYCDKIDEGVYDAVDMDGCVRRRGSLGGTSPEQVRAAIEYVRGMLSE